MKQFFLLVAFALPLISPVKVWASPSYASKGIVQSIYMGEENQRNLRVFIGRDSPVCGTGSQHWAYIKKGEAYERHLELLDIAFQAALFVELTTMPITINSVDGGSSETFCQVTSVSVLR